MPSSATSLRMAVGERCGSESCCRTACITLAFCRIARSSRMRCVAKRVCTPCCPQPESTEIRVGSLGGAVSCFAGGICCLRFAALQHHLKYTSSIYLCQDILAQQHGKNEHA